MYCTMRSGARDNSLKHLSRPVCRVWSREHQSQHSEAQSSPSHPPSFLSQDNLTQPPEMGACQHPLWYKPSMLRLTFENYQHFTHSSPWCTSLIHLCCKLENFSTFHLQQFQIGLTYLVSWVLVLLSRVWKCCVSQFTSLSAELAHVTYSLCWTLASRSARVNRWMKKMKKANIWQLNYTEQSLII